MALKSIILGPGECAVFPADAEIISVTPDGAITVSSDCITLPTPASYVCYKFFWEDDVSGSMQDAVFTGLVVGSTTYPTNQNYNHGIAVTIPIADWIDTNTEFNGIVKLACQSIAAENLMMVQIPAGLPAPILTITNPTGSGDQFLQMVGILDEGCSCA